MRSEAMTVSAYLQELSLEKRAALLAVRKTILKNLPKGYQEAMQYGMIGYSVPLKRYPKGYLGDKKTPLPYAGLASQKNHMSVYLMSIYANKQAERWFRTEYKKSGKKLDMGKSCVRFRKLENLLLSLIGKTIAKTSVKELITYYERSRPRKR